MDEGPKTASTGVYRSYFCAVLLVVVGALAYVWGHVKTATQLKELESLRDQRQSLLRQQERMRAEIAGLKQSSRIREIASRELGMVFPSAAPRNLYLRHRRPAVSRRGQDAH